MLKTNFLGVLGTSLQNGCMKKIPQRRINAIEFFKAAELVVFSGG
jgi:hypothetical protein